jgi:hypothetical protein
MLFPIKSGLKWRIHPLSDSQSSFLKIFASMGKKGVIIFIGSLLIRLVADGPVGLLLVADQPHYS